MITVEKLNIYKKYGGDTDSWTRSGDNHVSSKDWPIIDSLMQDIYIVETKNASTEYSTKLNRNLNEQCDSPETIHLLKEMSQKTYSVKMSIPNPFKRKISAIYKSFKSVIKNQ
jgi:hypothetical protein